MANIVSFSKTAEEYEKYAQRSIEKKVAAGQMTQDDADKINEFVVAMRIQNNISDSRAYKLTNALTNVTRFFNLGNGQPKPLLEKTFAEIQTAIFAIQKGKKIYCKNHKNNGELSQNVKRDYVIFLKRFYLWGIDEGYCNLSADKIHKIKPPKPERITKTAEQMLTPDEVLQMIEACNGSTAIRDKAMLSVLYEAGIRINELGNLLWSDVKFDRNFVKINVNSKTGIPRYIPMTSSLQYVAAWRSIYPDGKPEGDKPVFLTTKVIIENRGKENEKRTVTYQNLTYNYVRKHIADIGKRAGVQKSVSCHIWRHSRVTNLLQEGFNDSTIKMMCWGSLTSNMLANYGHLCNKDIDAAVARAAGLPLEDVKTDEDLFKNHICPNCHHINPPTAKYCSICGKPLTGEVELDEQAAKDEIHADERYKTMVDNLQKQVADLTQAIALLTNDKQNPADPQAAEQV